MTVAPGDLPFSRPVQGMQLPIDSQDFEPSYAEHASFIPDSRPPPDCCSFVPVNISGQSK